MQSEYVEQRNGGYYVVGTRVSLESVVWAFQEGLSPEAIQEDFPLLKLAQVYGAIAFYLDHQSEIDKYMEEVKAQLEPGGVPLSEENPELWDRLQRAKAQMSEVRQGEPRS
ncbi:MAG: DUF433 domain-containing protein [Bryobacterales bacterium]|nr:DUF433 domain-containing protein [Bryobacterales bacterium]